MYRDVASLIPSLSWKRLHAYMVRHGWGVYCTCQHSRFKREGHSPGCLGISISPTTVSPTTVNATNALFHFIGNSNWTAFILREEKTNSSLLIAEMALKSMRNSSGITQSFRSYIPLKDKWPKPLVFVLKIQVEMYSVVQHFPSMPRPWIQFNSTHFNSI